MIAIYLRITSYRTRNMSEKPGAVMSKIDETSESSVYSCRGTPYLKLKELRTH